MVQWEADERTLLAAVAKASNKTGYFGVYHSNPGEFKPYQARVSKGKRAARAGAEAQQAGREAGSGLNNGRKARARPLDAVEAAT